jgi:hypothetical protein
MHESQDLLPTIIPSQLDGEAVLLVSCVQCERLHDPDDPLGFSPLCPRCTAGFPLTRLDMDGSFPLTVEAIDEEIEERSPGNYALGYLDAGAFVVFYVGRSDSDLKSRLHEWVGAASQYVAYAPSGRASWGVHQRGTLPLNAPSLASAGPSDTSYTRFAYSYAASADAAYAKEWRNYEDFGGSRRLDNPVDPVSPDASRQLF